MTFPFSVRGLQGRWSLSRTIEDRRTGGTATMAGEAIFTPDGTGLHYRESGRLTLPSGQGFEADRVYLWRFPGPGRIEVLFQDGRPFHDFDPFLPDRERVHLCGPDTYRGRYRTAAEGWQSVWQVTGPRKDQRLVTDYARSG